MNGHTRIMPDGVVNSFDLGSSLEDIQEDWPSPSVSQIKRLIEFARAAYREQPNP